MEDVCDLEVGTIHQYQVAADHDMGVVRRRRRKHDFEFVRTRVHLAPQIRREISADYQATFQAGRKAVALGQAWWKMRGVLVIPAAGGIAIMIGIAVAVVLMAPAVAVCMFAGLAMAAAMIVVLIAVVPLVAAVVVLSDRNGGGKGQRKCGGRSGAKP